MGERYLELERLIVRLQNEGLFEPSRKRPLPEFPQRIGVITSPTGAVWHDIQTVVERRYPLTELVLAPCLVQGDTAAPSIIEAFEVINAEPGIDAVILARGGGSTEDLWTFNEETVARAVYGSRPPVISAVGHETNTTVADMVADVRAPTPSAAAELAVARLPHPGGARDAERAGALPGRAARDRHAHCASARLRRHHRAAYAGHRLTAAARG